MIYDISQPLFEYEVFTGDSFPLLFGFFRKLLPFCS